MLCKMTKAIRSKAAILLAAFYAFAMLTPHAALALNVTEVIHCLNDVGAQAGHSHDDQMAQHHHASPPDAGSLHDHFGKAPDGDPATPSACCGLFSVTGMISHERFEFGVVPRISTLTPALAERRDGEGPGNISKPPRA